MKNIVDGLLADFGVDIEKLEEKPKYYKFTSKITGKSVDIALLPDDIIIDGELRRIIRDETGAIPEWAIPINSKQDYIRLTPDCKFYGKRGSLLIVRYNRIHLKVGTGIRFKGSNNSKYSILAFLAYSFLAADKIDLVDVKFKVGDEEDATTKTDITTIITTIEGVSIEKYTLFNTGISLARSSTINGKIKPSYRRWTQMIKRCYGNYEHDKAYIGCSVHEKWHIYDYFETWFETNSYRISSDTLDLDKDALVNGNKEYGPDTCVLIPAYINSHLITVKTKKSNLPIGVSETNGRYSAQCTKFLSKEKIRLGVFNTPEEAHQAWADFKNKQLQEVVIPYFIEDVFEEDREHPMVLKVLKAMRNFKFK